MYKAIVLVFLVSLVNGQEPEPYDFAYSANTEDGATMTREENQNKEGVITGFYTVDQPDGFRRRVEYIADADGFRAKVKTNEIGTANANPADVVMESTVQESIKNGYVGAASSYNPSSKTSARKPVTQVKEENEGFGEETQAQHAARKSPVYRELTPIYREPAPRPSVQAPTVSQVQEVSNQIGETRPAPVASQIRDSEPLQASQVPVVKQVQVAQPSRPVSVAAQIRQSEPLPTRTSPVVTQVRQSPAQASRPVSVANQIRQSEPLPSRPVSVATQIRQSEPLPTQTSPVVTQVRQSPAQASRPVSVATQLRQSKPLPSRPVLVQAPRQAPSQSFLKSYGSSSSSNNLLGQGENVGVTSGNSYSTSSNGQSTYSSRFNAPQVDDQRFLDTNEGSFSGAQTVYTELDQAPTLNTANHVRYYLIPVQSGQTLKDAVNKFVARS